MIVFLNMDGTARIVSPERIFQGSNVNIVSAIYGGASNTPLQIAFTLPNGVVTPYAPMFYNIASQEESAGVWEYKIPRTVTEKYGTVGMTICATLPNGQQTSYNLTFNVEYAVLPVLPPEPDESVYDLILKYLAENQSQIVNLDTRVTDLENQVVRKTLLDITAEVEENQTVFTKYYTDGTTAQFSIPTGSGTAGRVNGNIVIKFSAANWRDTGTLEAPSGVYEIAFGPQQTGQGNSDFLSELSIADSYTYESGASVVPTAKNGYSTLAQKVFKGSDGSVLLTDVRVPFDGQLILFGGEYPTDATLSNVDGSSKVDGFTQSAVKGIAQAKNYYNLGAYDTYVSNGDGTGIVQRKMGYSSLENFNWIKYSGSDPKYIGIFEVLPVPEKFQIKLPSSSSIAANIKVPGFSTIPYNSGFIPDYSIALSVNGYLYIKISNTITEVAQLQPYIQGKILEYEFTNLFQYTEQVIENQPIRPANQDEEYYWHEEWKKGLNLSKTNRAVTGDNILIENAAVATYTLIITNSGDGADTGKYDLVYSGGAIGTKTFGDIVTFTTTSVGNISIYCNTAMGTPFVMLVRGSNPYPYEPYCGGRVREKDLSGIQLFLEGTNPAQTIGGDWEDLGTVTTSNSTVLHAYRRL